MRKTILIIAILFSGAVWAQGDYTLSKKEHRDIDHVAQSYGKVLNTSKGVYVPKCVSILVLRSPVTFEFSMLHFNKNRQLAQEIRWEIDPVYFMDGNEDEKTSLIDGLDLTYQQDGGPVVDLGFFRYE